MKFIKLKLEKQDDSKQIVINYDELFSSEDKLIVILGPPGSGKSTLLQHLHEQNPSISEYEKISVFLLDVFPIDKEKEILFLDGIDEYRSISLDKRNVLYEISGKLKKIDEETSIVLSCREMDWYGEEDNNALSKFIKKKATIYKILPLDRNQQIEFIKKNSPPELKKDLCDAIDRVNIFSNPQMLSMLIEISEKDYSRIESKIGLYEAYLEFGLEINMSYNRNLQPFTSEELIQYAGYLACFNLFARVENLNELDCSIICDNDKFKVEKMEIIKKSKIFSDGQFVHRTIAEFLFARFVINYLPKLDNNYVNIEEIPLINSFFIQAEKIPTQLRGAYSWLCSLSGSKKLTSKDPYYQVINGDNSLFSSSLKLFLIESVEEYLRNLEYKGDHLRGDVLAGFYTDDLDSFFLKDNYLFETIKTHESYSFKTFLVQIIIDAKDNLSSKLKDKIVEFVNSDSECPNHKSYFSKLFQKDYVIIKKLLEELKVKRISDNYLIDEYLAYLYPEHINIEETVDFLSMYESSKDKTSTYFAKFLNKTKEEDKRELIENLYEKIYSKKDGSWPNSLYNLRLVEEDFFQNTIMQYPSQKVNSRYIYELFTSFNEKYMLENIGRLLNENDYEYKLWHEKHHKSLSKKFTQLYFNSDEQKGKIEAVFDFFWKYGYFITEQTPEILTEFISQNNTTEYNKRLYTQILNIVKKPLTETFEKELSKLADEYDFNDELDQFRNPKKTDWQIRNEKEKRLRVEKEKKDFKDNTDYFKDKAANEILNNFGDMYFILFLYEQKIVKKQIPISETLYCHKLKPILKEYVFKNNESLDIATISAYAKAGIRIIRGIDRVYLGSMGLTDWEDSVWENDIGKELIAKSDLVKYLYIVSIENKYIHNYGKNNFHTSLEAFDKELVYDALSEYVKEVFAEQVPELNIKFVENLITNENIKIWKRISFCSDPSGTPLREKLLYFLLTNFNFKLKEEDLREIKKLASNSATHDLINSIVFILKEKRDEFNLNHALSIYNILQDERSLKSLDSTHKIRIFAYIMDCYPDYKSIEHKGGIHGKKKILGTYISRRAFHALSIGELSSLKTLMGNNNMWLGKINSQLEVLQQQENDNQFRELDVAHIKDLILNKKAVSQKMFFDQVVGVIKQFGEDIKANSNNELSLFYDNYKRSGEIPKHKYENSCRDVVLIKLKDRYGRLYEFTKEKHEADDRVDINVKYKQNPKYQVQIECKLDSSEGLAEKVKSQLIDKYLVKKELSGIYLIFEFKKISDKTKQQISGNIPDEFRDRVEVIYFDFKK